VKLNLLFAASALALALPVTPAAAQMDMRAMKMPAHKAKPAAKKPAQKKTLNSAKPTRKAVHPVRKPVPKRPSPSMTMPMSPGSTPTSNGQISMPMPSQPAPGASMSMPMPPTTPDAPMSMPIDQQQSSGMSAMAMNRGEHAMQGMSMHAALGAYVEQRESSGTAWQPDASRPMGGVMTSSGDWMLMAHGVAARRGQGVRLRHADGDGEPPRRQRHIAASDDAQPRPADGPARLSAAARDW
jgi:hypothetical protein